MKADKEKGEERYNIDSILLFSSVCLSLSLSCRLSTLSALHTADD